MGYVKLNCHAKTGEFFWEPRMIHHNSPSHFPGFSSVFQAATSQQKTDVVPPKVLSLSPPGSDMP